MTSEQRRYINEVIVKWFVDTIDPDRDAARGYAKNFCDRLEACGVLIGVAENVRETMPAKTYVHMVLGDGHFLCGYTDYTQAISNNWGRVNCPACHAARLKSVNGVTVHFERMVNEGNPTLCGNTGLRSKEWTNVTCEECKKVLVSNGVP